MLNRLNIEEMIAYVDWENSEDKYIQAQVEREVNPSEDTRKRGVSNPNRLLKNLTR
jgi:hypothetical protein